MVRLPMLITLLLLLLCSVLSAPDCGVNSGACGACADSLIDAFDPRTCDTQENHNMCTGVTKTVCGEPCPHGYGIFRNTGSCGFMWRSEEKQCAQCSAGFSASTACAQAECKVWGISVWDTCETQGGCIPCMPGKYAAAPGATTCTECPKGKQSYDDTAVTSTQLAKICKDAGTMSPYKCGSSTGCYTCPMGKYAENTGELLCDTCKGNTYTDQMGQDNCPYCPPGKQAENWDPDLIKEGGNIDDFYSACEADDCQEPEGTASTKCDPCPRGRFSTDVNEFREDDSSAQKLGCKSCFLSTMYGPGFTSDPGMDSCFHCPAGTVGNSSGLCELCEAGKYQNSTGGKLCNECRDYGVVVLKTTDPRRTGYISDRGAAHCTPCPAGKYMTDNMCLDCAVGKYSDKGWDTCITCNVGKSSGKGAPECFDCPVGQKNNDLGGNCTACEIGKYADKVGSLICKECMQNLVQMKTGKANCTWCDAGKFEASSPLANACTECGKGKYRERDSSAIECKNCYAFFGPGYVNGLTSVELNNIDPALATGMGADVQLGHATCHACPSSSSGGTHNTNNLLPDPTIPADDNRCHKCPDGLYSAAGATFCSVCLPGKEPCNCDEDSPDAECGDGAVCQAAGSGSEKCKACPAGKAGTGKCVDCPVGKMQGSYQPTPGGVGDKYNVCVDCVAGKESYQRKPGAITCSDCQPGNYSTGGELCKYCEGGKIPEDGQMFCKPCGTDLSTSLGGGEFASPGDATCSKCPAGRYSPRFQVNTNVNDCLVCPPGKFTEETGKVECDECEKGTFASTTETTVCVACTPGKVADEKGTIECNLCVAGKYDEDRKECKDCDKGKYTEVSGIYETGNTGSKVNCGACAAGEYQDTEGQASCKDCEVGKYQNSPGQEECKECSSGETSEAGALTCSNCPAGHIPDSTQDGLCVACEAGKKQNDDLCEDCVDGKYSSEASNSCTLCTKGKFTRGAGDTECLDEEAFFQVCPIGQNPITNKCKYWFQDRLVEVSEGAMSPFGDSCADLKACTREGSGGRTAFENTYTIYCNTCASDYVGFTLPNKDDANLDGISSNAQVACKKKLGEITTTGDASVPTMCYEQKGSFSNCTWGTTCNYMYVVDSPLVTAKLSPFLERNTSGPVVQIFDSCAEYKVCNMETSSGSPTFTIVCTKCASENGFYSLHTSTFNPGPAASTDCAGTKPLTCTNLGSFDTCPNKLASIYDDGARKRRLSTCPDKCCDADGYRTTARKDVDCCDDDLGFTGCSSSDQCTCAALTPTARVMNCAYQTSSTGTWDNVSPGDISPINHCEDYEICDTDAEKVEIQCSKCKDGYIGTDYARTKVGTKDNTCDAYKNPTDCVMERPVDSFCPNYAGDESIEVKCHYHAEQAKGWKVYDQGDKSPFMVGTFDTCKRYTQCYHNTTVEGTGVLHEYWVMCEECAPGYEKFEGNNDESYNFLPGFECIGNDNWVAKCGKPTGSPTPALTKSPVAAVDPTPSPTRESFNDGDEGGGGGGESLPILAIAGGAGAFFLVALGVMYKLVMGGDKKEKKKKKKKKKKKDTFDDDDDEERKKKKKKKKKKKEKDAAEEGIEMGGMDRGSTGVFEVDNPMMESKKKKKKEKKKEKEDLHVGDVEVEVQSDWVKYDDPNSGRPYWWNQVTNETTWECPE